MAGELGWWGVLLAVIGGAIRVSTPYLFVSLGEALTERSGRVNLGLEGTLVMGAMSGYAIAWLTGSPWLGVLVAGLAGAAFGLFHALVCSLPRVNDVAVGIALFILGTGLAFYLGKPYIQPTAPRLPHLALGAWSSSPQVRSALEINGLFIAGVVLAPALLWALRNTRWGLIVRTVGDNADAARALGYSVASVRAGCTAAGGFLAGVGGAFLSLYYPGTWNEGLSSGQGLMAIALVIFARWNPVHCFWVSLLFGGATALGPALQSVGVATHYYLLNAAPYVLTLGLLVWSSSTRHTLVGAPSELSIQSDGGPEMAPKPPGWLGMPRRSRGIPRYAPGDVTPPAVEIVGMSKRFGDLQALDGLSLTLPPGAFHAILGENGAGKSTLVKCVMGYYRPDAGRVVVDGEPRAIAGPRDAHALGFGMVYQHFTLVPSMTVAENLVLGTPDLPAVVRWDEARARIDQFQRRMPFRIEPDRLVSTLAAGEKQRLEIQKPLFRGCRVLILDEPTSVLTPEEADQILGALREMTEEGLLTVVMITHKLREVEAFAREVTVLRAGRRVAGGRVGELTRADLVGAMVGGAAPAGAAARAMREPGPVAIELDRLTVLNDRGTAAIRAVSLVVREGEIVGVAGVSGNGQRELVEVLAGQRASEAGEVRVAGARFTPTRAALRGRRVHVVPEEPLANACVRGMSVAENLAFRSYDEPRHTVAGVFLRRGALRAEARELIARYRIRTQGPDARLETLSGGNIQRMVLARELSAGAAVLVVQNPCAGLDIAATAETRARLMAARNGGAAVLLVSEDLDELLELADRIVVMFEGRLVYETPRERADLSTIGHYMASV